MAIRTEVYPLNFIFSHEAILNHWPITYFLDELKSDKLWTLQYSAGKLQIRFDSVFRGLGFKKEIFDSTNAESASRTLREITKGISRIRKISKEVKLTREFFINILRNEDRESPACDIIRKLDGFIMMLRTTGGQYLLRNHAIDSSYVSPLLLSYLTERWMTMGGSIINTDLWECMVYDGTAANLMSKMKNLLRIFRTPDSDVIQEFMIYFPLGFYDIIRDVTEPVQPTLAFTDYQIVYFTDDLTMDNLQQLVNCQPFTVVHVLPHYLIYHYHRFNTESDLIHYLEWSVYRSQREAHKYTSSVTYENGLRCTRACLISTMISDYGKFLNYLLWHSFNYQIDTPNMDQLEWHSILFSMFETFWGRLSDEDLSCDGHYAMSNFLRNYLQALPRNRNTENDIRVTQLLTNLLNQTYSSTLQSPTIRTIGRDAIGNSSHKPVLFSEIPNRVLINPIDWANVNFYQFTIESEKFRNIRGKLITSLLGATNNVYETEERFSIPENLIINDIRSIRDMECIRALNHKMAPFNVNDYIAQIGDEMLLVEDGTCSFWLGLLIHYSKSTAEINQIIDDGYVFQSTFGLEVSMHKRVINQTLIYYNQSTPKLCSVFDTYFSNKSVINGRRVPVTFDAMRGLFKRVLILGAVGEGDPFGKILQNYFQSQVTQVGAFGTGEVTRAEAGSYAFNVNYTTIVSDMDQSSVTTLEDIHAFLDCIILYMRNIEPLLAVWKINYATSNLEQVILNYLVDKLPNITSYNLTFIRPQFAHIANLEKFLTFEYIEEPREISEIRAYGGELKFRPLRQRLPCIEEQVKTMNGLLDSNEGIWTRRYIFVTSPVTCIERTLTLLSHYSRSVTMVRGGSNYYLSYYAFGSPERQRLTQRIAGYLGLSTIISERFSSETINDARFTYQRYATMVPLGTFWRELSRLLILTKISGFEVLTSGQKFKDLKNDLHYVGIGDERVRNIIIVPSGSPYTIYDVKTYPIFEAFNVTYIDQLFPLNDVNRIVQEITDLYHQHQKKLVLLFTYMLFNQHVHSAEQYRIFRNLSTALYLAREMVHSMFLNFYLITPDLPDIDEMTNHTTMRYFGDLLLERHDNEDGAPNYRGTLSDHYVPVDLLSLPILRRIAHEEGVILDRLEINEVQLKFLMWNMNLALRPEVASGLSMIANFSPMLQLRVGV